MTPFGSLSPALSPLTFAVRSALLLQVGLVTLGAFTSTQSFATNLAVSNPIEQNLAPQNTVQNANLNTNTSGGDEAVTPTDTLADNANLNVEPSPQAMTTDLLATTRPLTTTTTPETTTTTDITANNSRSTIAIPEITPEQQAYSAKTRSGFTPNAKQQNSLQRLKPYYQPKPTAMLDNTASTNALNTQPMCRGTWVYPTNKYQRQNAQDASTAQNLNKPNTEFSLYAEADYGYYDNASYAELSGNVLVNQGRQQISADKVVVNLQDGMAAAQGNVSIVDANNEQDPIEPSNTANSNAKKSGVKGGLITMADEIAYQTNDDKATAKDVAFASVPLQAHGYAKQLNQVDASHYEVQDVMFTTCPPDRPTWQINAKQVDVNNDTGRGEAYNATLKIKNTPVLYLPYFNFPIDDRRTSGVLLPRGGFTSDGGLQVQVPYYFNLAPNYDATVTATAFTNKNPMLTGEFRYLTQDYGKGELTGSFLPSDKQYHDDDRSSVFFNHHWQSPKYPTLSVDAVYQHVSDSAYFNDFDTLGIAGNPLNLPQRLQATYYDDNFTALAKVEQFQTLDDDLSDNQGVLDKDKPYKRLPQLSLNYKLPWFSQFNLTGTSDFAYFKRPIKDGSAVEQSGGRLYNRLNASYPIERAWGYVTPTVSLQHLYTQFDEETTAANQIPKDNKSRSIFVPQFSVDAALNFFKAGSPLDGFSQKATNLGGYQIIQPRLKYMYAPYKNQSDVPNFTTRFASLNYPQLFEDSWFLGYDRLADSHYVTPAVNYRYIDGKGLTRVDASIGQQFYRNDIRVHLDDTNTPLKINSSGTVLQVSTQPKENLWADFDGAITDGGNLGYYNLQMRYQPNTRSLYNLGFIKRNDNLIGQKNLSAITASAIFPLNDSWRFLGAMQYDQQRNRYSDVLVGLDYESCCYGLAIYGRSYYNDLNDKAKPTRAIMAELSLSGIANKRDGRLASMVNDRVLGFNHLNRF